MSIGEKLIKGTARFNGTSGQDALDEISKNTTELEQKLLSLAAKKHNPSSPKKPKPDLKAQKSSLFGKLVKGSALAAALYGGWRLYKYATGRTSEKE